MVLLINHDERQGIRDCISEVWRRLDDESWSECGTEVKFRFQSHCAMDADGSPGMTMPALVSALQYQGEHLRREALVTRMALTNEKLICSFIAERMLEPPKSC